MAEFPRELDKYLEFCAKVYNFDFQAISVEFVSSAAELLRHPLVDEPEELLQARAKEAFSPQKLREQWQRQHGGDWEVIVPVEDWEVLTSDGIHLDFEEVHSAAGSFIVLGSDGGPADDRFDFVPVGTGTPRLLASGEDEEEEENDEDSSDEEGPSLHLPVLRQLEPSLAQLLGLAPSARGDIRKEPEEEEEEDDDEEWRELRLRARAVTAEAAARQRQEKEQQFQQLWQQQQWQQQWQRRPERRVW